MSVEPRAWRPEDLGYCSNVHPAEVLDDVICLFGTVLADVRAARALERMASGLWLSAAAVGALESKGARANFRARLADAGIELRTLNAFPYGDFHSRAIKEGVFVPDWADERRLQYTLAAAEVLAECLPPDAPEGTISTVPLGLRATWAAEKENRATGQLLEAARELDRLAARTGRLIRVCLEPEPGATLERADQTAAFFDGWLLPAADALRVPREIVRRHLGVCFDVCHQSVLFENPADALARLLDAGVGVGKIQLSCALEAPDAQSKTALAAYAEPRYLHQVRVRDDDHLDGVPDLDQALGDGALPRDRPWRVHFHVPVHRDRYPGGLTGTRADVLGVLDFLAARRTFAPHLEVETYTWLVLPEGERPSNDAELVGAIAAELSWVESQMQRRGLMV